MLFISFTNTFYKITILRLHKNSKYSVFCLKKNGKYDETTVQENKLKKSIYIFLIPYKVITIHILLCVIILMLFFMWEKLSRQCHIFGILIYTSLFGFWCDRFVFIFLVFLKLLWQFKTKLFAFISKVFQKYNSTSKI